MLPVITNAASENDNQRMARSFAFSPMPQNYPVCQSSVMMALIQYREIHQKTRTLCSEKEEDRISIRYQYRVRMNIVPLFGIQAG